MINFPDNPTLNQVFTSGAQSWTWDGAKWVASGVYVGPPQFSNANRIINGDMRIDQRNNGASGTAGGYTVDRWFYNANVAGKGNWGRAGAAAGGAIAQAGFQYVLNFTSSSAYTPLTADQFGIHQRIEADMVSDFCWGTANAQPVTLSFLAMSSLTGTFGGSIRNDAGTRAYPFSFSLPVASTWTKIAITIPGDTAGTWVMAGNGEGLRVYFDLGGGATYRAPAGAWTNGDIRGVNGGVNVVATNGAGFNLTGVKLEIGSIATPFNRKSPQESLADCQRYCYRVGSTTAQVLGAGYVANTTTTGIYIPFPVTMRDLPVNSASSGAGFQINGTATTNITPVLGTTATNGMQVNFTCAGLTTGFGAIATVNANNWMAFTAEL